MLRIGDFSKLAQVTVRALRHYEQLGLLKAKHVDPFTGYRYYELDQLPRLHRILALKDLGFSLEQIAALLESDLSPELLRGMLMAKEAELKQAQDEGATRLQRVAARLRQIEARDDLDAYEIVLKSVPALTVASIRSLIPEIEMVGRYCDTHFEELEAWLRHHHLPWQGPTMNLYYNDEFTETDIDMESAVLVQASARQLNLSGRQEVAIREMEAVAQMASLVHPLSFARLSEGIIALLTWVSVNGYDTAGPMREIHLFGHPKTVDTQTEVVMELQVPVSRDPTP